MNNAELKAAFQSDKIRAEIAHRGDIVALRHTYFGGLLPELEDMSSAALWDDLALSRQVPDFRLRRLQSVANLVTSGSSVLDVGVGWGEIIPMLGIRRISSYTGIDFSENIIRQVEARYPGVKFHVGGVEDINDVYDFVLALEVCEHILPSRIMSFYAEISRVLAEGGKFVISVPLNEDLEVSTLRCPGCKHLHSRMGHVRVYTQDLIRRELEIAGFRVVHSYVHYANFSQTPFGRMKRSIVDLGRTIFNMGRTLPLGVVVVAVRAG